MEYITHYEKNWIVFNPDKIHFAGNEVEFAGFLITVDGVKPTKKMTDVILHFPTPTNTTLVRSWFGLMNQRSDAFSRAKVMTPLRELLRSKNRKFYRNEMLDQLF